MILTTAKARKVIRPTLGTRNTTYHTIRRILTQRKGETGILSQSFPYSSSIRRYSLRDGATFVEQAQNVAFDLAGDEGVQDRKRRELKWDKKKKKFVKGSGEGADNVKLVKTESGVKLPATYRSGRFDEWKAQNRISIPRVGEAEAEGAQRRGSTSTGGRKYKHNQVAAAKPFDKLSKDFERKVRQKKKKEDGTDGGPPARPLPSGKRSKAVNRRSGGKALGRIKTELKTVDQIRKARKVTENRRAKNARPGRGKGKR